MTTSPVMVEKSTDAGPGGRGRRIRSKGAIGFAIGFALSAVLTALATMFAVSGAGVIQPGSPVLIWLLAASLVIGLILAAIIVHRVARIARGHNSAIPGARLHLKFISLFSMAALAPAIVVAAFMGAALNQGVENWFSQRVQTIVERGADVGRYLVAGVRDSLREDVRLMASDLNQAASGLRTDPERYQQYLSVQAQNRFLSAAYVIDGRGNVLSRAESEEAPAFAAPAVDVFAEAAANGGFADRIFERESVIRALTRLDAYPNAYLYVVRPVDPLLLQRTREFSDGVAAYREAESRRNDIQTLFALSYLATAGLVLLGAIWVGLSFATRIAEPIGKLAAAARRVAAGDLGARVLIGPERDEVDALGVAFNQMTAQLDNQRRELVDARHEAEGRSRFVQALLAGDTAGVIGTDRDGRISASNRSAALLLGMDGETRMEGRRLVDVVP
ncbi:MAG: HAMP domain-containing protein, partial [Hyphomonadaceae bacterium]